MNFAMSDDDGPRQSSDVAAERSGAFIARVWSDGDGVRTRVRQTVDLAQDETVQTVRGDADLVAAELELLVRRWIETFAAGDEPRPPMTDR